jgi:hypothetical protein
MGLRTYPAAEAGIELRQTITSAGSVTIPASQGFVYAAIGSSTTSIQVAGWVPTDGTYTNVNSLYYYSCLVGTGPNLYIYY